MAIPKSKTLSLQEIRDCGILEKEKSEITLEYVRDLFACHIGESEPKFNTYDKFTLPAGKLYNKEAIQTTIGRYLTNLVSLPEVYLKKYGYVNKPFDKDTIGDIEGQMAAMILDDDGSEWVLHISYHLL